MGLSSAQPVCAQGKSADEIFIQPLNNLETGLFGVSSKAILESIIPDNYQAYCANPTSEVHADVVGDYERYLELYRGREFEVRPDIEFQLDKLGLDGVVDISNPLIVDDRGDYSDIDQTTFQGNYEVRPEILAVNPDQENVITADYYKRLSLAEQCTHAKKTQTQVRTLCKQKDIPPDQCPLNIVVPNSGFRVMDVPIPECKALEDPEVIRSTSESVLSGITNMPFPHINGKRVAFLMRCVEHRPSWSERLFDQSILDVILGFLRLGVTSNDDCHVLAIGVDSATTEQQPQNDPIEFQHLSRQILTPYEDWELEKAEYASKKSYRLERALSMLGVCGTDQRIDCDGWGGNPDTNLKLALAAYVNAMNPQCDDLRTEESETISSQAKIEDGGGNYKASAADAFKTFAAEGILSTLKSTFKSIFNMGSLEAQQIESRKARVETFIIAPYDSQFTLNDFLVTLDEQAHWEEIEKTAWPTHIQFNETDEKEAEDKSTTEPFLHTFYDPDKCEYDQYGEEIPGSCDRKTGAKISDYGQLPSVPNSNNPRGNNQAQASLFEDSNPIHDYIIETLFTNPDTELFLKGVGGGEDSAEGEGLACSAIQNMTTELPTMNGLMRMACGVAGNDKYDAQLLWGLMQIEGWNMLNAIADGKSSISCGEIVYNSCGASQITGQLVPQCIDKEACPQAAYIAEDTSDPTIAEMRNNPEIACDIRTQLDFTLDKRKSEIGYLTSGFTAANGRSPSKEELYQMMAGRNYGVPEEYLFQPGCGDYEAVPGCDGANYCVCAINTFPMECGNIR